MAQLILKDSGLLIEEGNAAALAAANDPAFYAVVDTGQVFDAFDMTPGQPTVGRVPDRQVWFYFPTKNRFFQSTRKYHAIEKAIGDEFGAARGEEILDYLERFGPIRETLDKLDTKKARRKLVAAVNAGHITAQEAQALRDLIVHLPNGA